MTARATLGNIAAVHEPSARVWKKIGCFYALTMLFSGAFDAFVLQAGKMDAGNMLYVTGAMWSPALAAFATKKLFGESIRDMPWALGPIEVRLARLPHSDRVCAAGLCRRCG